MSTKTLERPVGRPTKLNRKLIAKAEEALAEGFTEKGTAQWCRIGISTWCSWKVRGEKERKAGEKSLYTEFLDAVYRGLEEGDLTFEQVCLIEARKNPVWAKDRLAHRGHEEFIKAPAAPLVTVTGPNIRVIAPGAPVEEDE